MVHYHRHNQPLKKGLNLALIEEDEESQSALCGNSSFNKRIKPKLLTLLILSLLSCSLIFAPQFLNFPSDFSLLYSFGHEDKALVAETDVNMPLCSSVSNGTLCCDRSSVRSDVCIMKGDVRTHSLSSSLYLYTSKNIKGVIDDQPDTKLETEKEWEEEIQHEKIRPYTRKWEANTMSTIDELDLISKNKNSKNKFKCDVHHDVPAVFFSTGGYTGNVYHEFNDGILQFLDRSRSNYSSNKYNRQFSSSDTRTSNGQRLSGDGHVTANSHCLDRRWTHVQSSILLILSFYQELAPLSRISLEDYK